MPELIVGLIIAVGMTVKLSQPEYLGKDEERAWVNHLADQARKADAVRSYRRRAHVQRPAYKYAAVYMVARK